MKKILVIDDDVHIGNLVQEMLEKEGYSVTRAYSGTEALLVLAKYKPDLILFDLMLPGLNGEELLPKLSGITTIIVSAKDQVSDNVDLLLGGAADYITKPFDMHELLARVAVQLRNSRKPAETTVLTHFNLQMDTAAYTVCVGEQPVKLTKTEFAILKLLLQNPDQVITKSVMLDRISEDTPDCMESSLKVHMSNLRRKLRQAGDREYIESVWGIGFKLV